MSDAVAEAPTIDVSSLPRTMFGYRGLTWWATTGFMLIEGTTLAVLLVAYVYLRRNFLEWPPAPARLPDLLVPTINLVVLLVTILPMALARRAAHALDLPGVRLFLSIAVLLSVVAVILRGFEFGALNVRWDQYAYGSAAWILVGMHTTLLVVDLVESAVITAMMFRRDVEQKHYTDVEESALYQFFLSLSWVPVYTMVYLGPRVF